MGKMSENSSFACSAALADGLLTDRVALITGAARGMGFAIAEGLARRGARIAVNDLSQAGADDAVTRLHRLGFEAIALPGDVSDDSSVQRIFRTLNSSMQRLDILVNNAGVLRPTRGEAITEDEWEFVIDNNLKNTFLCCKAAIPLLRERGGGAIVNISSSAGKSVSTLGGPHYTAAKAGVLGLTRHLARELAAAGIRVNAVCPGLIDTDMVRGTVLPAVVDTYARSFPMGRLGTPEEVADLVVYLASTLSSYITGASIDINGGDLTI
jgi:NAD(P)-dependent dehydrogenase (short-subunit alcohol dehydrogenase family)